MIKLKDILIDDERLTNLPDNLKERLFKKIIVKLGALTEKEIFYNKKNI